MSKIIDIEGARSVSKNIKKGYEQLSEDHRYMGNRVTISYTNIDDTDNDGDVLKYRACAMACYHIGLTGDSIEEIDDEWINETVGEAEEIEIPVLAIMNCNFNTDDKIEIVHNWGRYKRTIIMDEEIEYIRFVDFVFYLNDTLLLECDRITNILDLLIQDLELVS